jgi:hypothetical protein
LHDNDASNTVAKNDAHISAATTMAVDRVRRRNMPSGRIGALALVSATTKSPSRTAPPARNPTVVADVHPNSTLLLMPYTAAIRPAVTENAPNRSADPRSTGALSGT